MSDTEHQSPPPSPTSVCSEPAAPTQTFHRDRDRDRDRDREGGSYTRLVETFVRSLGDLKQQNEAKEHEREKERDTLEAQLQVVHEKLNAQQARRVGAKDRAIGRESTIRELQADLDQTNEEIRILRTTHSDTLASIDELQRTNDRLRLLDTEQAEHNARLRTAFQNLKDQNKQLKVKADDERHEAERRAADLTDLAMRDRAKIGTSILTEEIALVPNLPNIPEGTANRISNAIAAQPPRKVLISEIQRGFGATEEVRTSLSGFIGVIGAVLREKDLEEENKSLKRLNTECLRQIQGAAHVFEEFQELTGMSIEDSMKQFRMDMIEE